MISHLTRILQNVTQCTGTTPVFSGHEGQGLTGLPTKINKWDLIKDKKEKKYLLQLYKYNFEKLKWQLWNIQCYFFSNLFER